MAAEGGAMVMATWLVIWAAMTPWAATSGIKGEPRVTERWDTRKVVREGEPVRLQCPITGNPPPFYEWFKGREQVRASWQRYSTKKHILRIKGVTTEDSGAYTCDGVNGFGKVNASMHLIVLGKDEPEGEVSAPELTRVWPDTAQRKRMGDDLTLTCRARGLPTPSVTWHKDGLELGKVGEQITFQGLLATDSGFYVCKANSALGQTQANFTVHVGDVNEEQQELEISDAVNTTVTEGGSTSLQCTVRTSLHPKVEWLKETTNESPIGKGAGGGGFSFSAFANATLHLQGRKFRRIEDVGPVVSRGDGTYLSKLTIHNAEPRDAGVYVCLGVNTLGYSFREAHLTVLHHEAGKQVPPSVGQKDKNVNWLFFIIPAIVIIIVVVVVIVCQLRKSAPDKPVGVTPPTPVLKGDDASALAPLNPETHAHALASRPPDLVYQWRSDTGPSLCSQEVTGYASSSTRGAPLHGSRYGDKYPSPYPESYADPAYSDPYSGDRGPTRSSDHSYARLAHHPNHQSHPHPSLASHTSHASSSPHLPPPYAHSHPQQHPHTHQHAHTHRHPQYFVHYNL